LTNSNFYRSLTTTNIATGFFLENLKRIKKLNIFSGPKQSLFVRQRWYEVLKWFHSN